MRNMLFIFLILILTSFVVSSCQKCTTCVRPNLITGEDIPEEHCGTGKEVNEFEAGWLEDYDSIGGYCLRK